MNDGHNLLQGGGDWTNVIIPGNAQNSGFNHKMTYEVTNLRNDAEYECLVQARNQFGWSEASRIFHFYTGKRGTKLLFKVSCDAQPLDLKVCFLFTFVDIIFFICYAKLPSTQTAFFSYVC